MPWINIWSAEIRIHLSSFEVRDTNLELEMINDRDNKDNIGLSYSYAMIEINMKLAWKQLDERKI